MKTCLFILINWERAFVKKVILLLAILTILAYGNGSFAQGLEESFSTISTVNPQANLNNDGHQIVKYGKNFITFAHTLDTGLDKRQALFLHLGLNLPEKYEQALSEKKEYVYPLYGVGQKYFIDATSSYVVDNYYTSILVKNHFGKDSLIRNTGFEYPLTSLNEVYRFATNKFQQYKGADCKLHITTSGLISSYGLWKPTYSFTESRDQFDYFEDISIRFHVTSNGENNLIPSSIESLMIIDEAQTPLLYRKGKLPTRGIIDTHTHREELIRVPHNFIPEDTVLTMMRQVFTDETSSLNLPISKAPIRNKGQKDFTGARIYRYTKVETKIIKQALNPDNFEMMIQPGDKVFFPVNSLVESRIAIDVFDTKKMFGRYNYIYDSIAGNENFDTLVNFLYINNYEYINGLAIYNKHSCIVYNVVTGERYNLSIPRKKRDRIYQLDYTGVSNGSELPKNLNIKFGTPYRSYQFGTFTKSKLEYDCASNGCEFSRKSILSLAPLYIYAVLRNN